MLNLNLSQTKLNIIVPSQLGDRLVEKLCAIIPEMEPQEVPPFVYQLLFLCDQSDHLVPLQHLTTFFQAKLRRCAQGQTSGTDSMEIDSDIIGKTVQSVFKFPGKTSTNVKIRFAYSVIENGSFKEILQAKATSVFHISRAAATGHPLGREFLKFIRNRRNIPELVLVPFVLEVALSLGGLPQLRDVIDLLKSVIQNCLQSNEKQRHSAWMREMMLGKELDVQDLLNTIMEQSTSEGDNIFKGIHLYINFFFVSNVLISIGLELLAFSLLEIRTPGFPGRPVTAVSSTNIGNTQGASSMNSTTI